MVLFDKNGCMKKYNDACEILKDFYELRFEFYGKRKQYLEGMLEAEALKLSNQARFILEKCDGSLVIENKKKKVMIADLIRKNFDPGNFYHLLFNYCAPILKKVHNKKIRLKCSHSSKGPSINAVIQEGEGGGRKMKI